MKSNKERFMQYANWRLKQKEYKKKLIESDIANLQIKAMEKTRNRKISQF